MKQKETKQNKKKKINLKNYIGTSDSVIRLVIANRILSIISLVCLPIMLAILVAYDTGAQDFICYFLFNVNDATFNLDINSFFNFFGGITSVLNVWLPLLIWLVSGLLIWLFMYLGIAHNKTGRSRKFQGGFFIFLNILIIGGLLAIQFFKLDLPHSGQVKNHTSYDYWASLQNTYNIGSPYFIGIFIFIGCTFVIWIIEIIEGSLINKGKLRFTDLYSNDNDSNSLVYKVLNKNIEFGDDYEQFQKENKLDKNASKKLKNKTSSKND